MSVGQLGTPRDSESARPITAELPVAPVRRMDDDERAYLLDELNRTAAPRVMTGRVHEAFDAQVERTPDRPALSCQGRTLTYRELAAAANRLAHVLVARGAAPGALIGVCMARREELVVALLAVLKAGCAYVPLDPGYPAERLRAMAEDAGLALIVTDAGSRGTLSGLAAQALVVEELAAELAAASELAPARPGSPGDLMYVIYTSGSTGKPKGVMVEHQTVTNFLDGMRARLRLEPAGTWLSATSYSFDISVLEIFGSLTHGFKLVLLGENRWGVASDAEFTLPRELVRHAVTHFQCTPSQALLLLSDDESRAALGQVQEMLVGGEALGLDVAERLLAAMPGRLFNMYGPTETTIWSSCAEVRRGEREISLGRPIVNTTFYVLDEQGAPVPRGVIGELHIGGLGVARGYLNRPELTAERFVRDPFAGDPAARMYRTGDLVRYRADGSLEFLGRNDFQVKIRGFRIELGEIESVLRTDGGAREAVVVALQNGAEPRLVAYAVAGPGVDASTLREAARGKLPAHMVPAQFVLLDALPLTESGKVDRKRLPDPGKVAAVEPQRAPRPGPSAAALSRVHYLERPRSAARALAGQRWLLLVDDTGLGERAVDWLKQLGVEVIAARLGHGPALAREDAHNFVIDADRGLEGPGALVRELAGEGRLPHVILHLWTVTTDERFRSETNRFHHNEERGYFALIGLAQGLLALDERPDLRIVTVTNGALSARGEPVRFPEKALALGPVGTLPREDPRIACCAIDVEIPLGTRRALLFRGMLERSHDALLSVLVPEAAALESGVYALRGERVFARGLEPLRRAPEAPRELRHRGTYLVTGGFGGIGHAVARELVGRGAARIVLLGRTPLPDRSYWSDWLAKHGESDAVSARIRMVSELEALGAEVLALSADVAHPESMRSALTQVRRRFGALHGVVHAAGVLDEALLAAQSLDQAREGIAAEVLGARMLAELTDRDALDFFVLIGHAQRLAPRPGVSARVAASHFAEGFVDEQRRPHARLFELGYVRDRGMFAELTRALGGHGAVRDPNARALIEQVERGLPVELAARTLVDALGSRERKLVIGEVPEPVHFELAASGPSGRAFVAPEGETERALAAMWAEALGVEAVGAEDDFFDLGGHSLVAVRLTARIKQHFDVQIPLAVFIEAPTVRALARVLNRASHAAGEAGPRGASRLSEWSTVVPLQEHGDRPALFCVGGKGGNVMNLRHLARLCGNDQPVFGLQARGVDGKLEPHRTLEGMVDEYVGDLRKVRPHGPYFLAGFSGGGAVIVEMARKLRAAGEVVGPLVFLDAWNPRTPERSPWQKVQAHAGLLRELGPRYVPIAVKRALVLRGRELLMARAPQLAQRIWDLPVAAGVEGYWDQIAEQYEGLPYEGRAVLFRVRADRSAGELDYTDDEHNGWGPVVTGGIEVIEVPGDHNSLLEEPHVRTLAQSLRLSLDRAVRAFPALG